jgi:thioesterase-3
VSLLRSSLHLISASRGGPCSPACGLDGSARPQRSATLGFPPRVAATGARVRAELASTARADGRQDPRPDDPRLLPRRGSRHPFHSRRSAEKEPRFSRVKNRIRIKVRGYHLDVYGHVNNARYLEFLEEARWSFIENEIDLPAWKKLGFAFTVVKITINYRRAASLGDVLDIHTRLEKLGARSGVVRQEITLARTGGRVADAEVVFVIVDEQTGKAAHLEGEIYAALKSLAT